jgi:hypothetical protein
VADKLAMFIRGQGAGAERYRVTILPASLLEVGTLSDAALDANAVLASLCGCDPANRTSDNRFDWSTARRGTAVHPNRASKV